MENKTRCWQFQMCLVLRFIQQNLTFRLWRKDTNTDPTELRRWSQCQWLFKLNHWTWITEGSKYWNRRGQLGKRWLPALQGQTAVPSHSASASVAGDGLHFSLVPQFSGFHLNPVSLWKTLQWRGPETHMNRCVQAWDLTCSDAAQEPDGTCSDRESNIPQSRFCTAGLLAGRLIGRVTRTRVAAHSA